MVNKCIYVLKQKYEFIIGSNICVDDVQTLSFLLKKQIVLR